MDALDLGESVAMPTEPSPPTTPDTTRVSVERPPPPPPPTAVVEKEVVMERPAPPPPPTVVVKEELERPPPPPPPVVVKEEVERPPPPPPPVVVKEEMPPVVPVKEEVVRPPPPPPPTEEQPSLRQSAEELVSAQLRTYAPSPDGASAWCAAFSITGLEADDGKRLLSSFRGSKSYKDATLKMEISKAVEDGKEPEPDEEHPLATWRTETISEVGETLSFAVPASLAGLDDGKERVVKVKLEVAQEATRPGGKASSTVVGLATFLASDLVSRQWCEARLGGGPAMCVATRFAAEPSASESVASGVGDPCCARIDECLMFGLGPARDLVVEPRGTHDLVRGAVQPVADAMLESAAAWLRRSEAARTDAALFDDDTEAGRHGARRARVAVLGARGLSRRRRAGKKAGSGSSGDRSPRPDGSSSKSTVKKTFSAAVGLARRIRDGEAPRLGVDDGGDDAPPSCFAIAEFRSNRRPFPEELGRTNTEYATESPAFGANARADTNCPHAKPQREFVLSTASLESSSKRRPIATLRSPQDCGDPAGLAPVFEFYTRRDEAPGVASVLVHIYDERYSVTRGLENVFIGTASLTLPGPSETASPVWVPLALAEDVATGNSSSSSSSNKAAVLISAHVASLDEDADVVAADARFEADAARRAERFEADAALLHSWLAIAGIKVDAGAAQLAAASESTNSSDPGVLPGLHDSTWLESHARSLARDGAQLARFVEDAQEASASKSSAFKSSALKAELNVAATPTNLHVHVFAARAPSAAEERIWTSATSGAPTAAGTLGSQRGGLLKLEAELEDLAATIRAKRASFDALPKAPGRRNAAGDLGAAARAWEARAAACAVRKTLCRAHAICIAAASARAAACRVVAHDPEESAEATADAWERHGFLVVFEALVSTAGAELAMLEDAKSAVDALSNVTVVFEPFQPDDHHAVHIEVGSSPGTFRVNLRLPHAIFAGLGNKTREIKLVPAIFSQGLDAKQSIANRKAAFGSTLDWSLGTSRSSRSESRNSKASSGEPGHDALDDDDAALDETPSPTTPRNPSSEDDTSAFGIQRLLNAQAFDTIKAYAIAARGSDVALGPLKAAIDKERLAATEAKSFEKHWMSLVEAERATRALQGGLCVFCKSGKDRTGMMVTLFAAMFYDSPRSSSEGGGAPAEQAVNDEAVLRRANLLREYGVRLPLCLKNTGRYKYAFNMIQRKFLPPPLRPPTSVIETLIDSAINRDTS